MKLTYLILLVCLLSCVDNKEKGAIKILDYFIDSQSEGCLVIPGEGCGGCISEATGYFLKNKDWLLKNNIEIVFTGVGEIKRLKIIIGPENLKLPIVHIDSSDRFINSGLIGSYPVYYSLSNKEIIHSIEISPSRKKNQSIENLISDRSR